MQRCSFDVCHVVQGGVVSGVVSARTEERTWREECGKRGSGALSHRVAGTTTIGTELLHAYFILNDQNAYIFV